MSISPFAPERAATAADIVKRLVGSDYEWTAINALGGGMGPAQLRHSQAVAAAEAAGLVVTTIRRGVPVVQLNRTAAVDAQAAVTAIDTDPRTQILAAQLVEGRLIVAMRNETWDLALAVDTFRRPTAAETDPELVDWARVDPDAWLLVEQASAGDMDEVVELVREAREAATGTPQRRLIAAGKRIGASRIAWSYPMSLADIDAHAASSHVSPSALTDEEHKELSDKVREVNKRSSGRK